MRRLVNNYCLPIIIALVIPVSDIINYLNSESTHADIVPYTMLGDADCNAKSLEPVLTSIGQSNVPVLPTVSADSAG